MVALELFLTLEAKLRLVLRVTYASLYVHSLFIYGYGMLVPKSNLCSLN